MNNLTKHSRTSSRIHSSIFPWFTKYSFASAKHSLFSPKTHLTIIYFHLSQQAFVCLTMCSFVSPCIYLFQLTVNICHAAFTCLTQKSLVNPACPSIHLSHPSLTCLTQHVLALTCLIQHSLVSPRIHLSHPSLTCLTQHVPALTCIISHFSLSNYLSIIKQLPVSLSSIYLSHQPFNYYDLFHQALFP